MAILYIDLDRFKEVNDLYGHDAGDMVLVDAAAHAAPCGRPTPLHAWVAMSSPSLTTQLDNSGHVDFVCQNLLAGLSTAFPVKKNQAYVTASIGVALYPIDAADPEELLRRADQAMFAAKRNGKNQFCYFMQSMDDTIQAADGQQ